MVESTAWYDKKYHEVFEQELRGLTRRFEANPNCPISEIEQQLHHLYIQQGNNQDGRGEVADIVLSATIAAFESFIFDYKATQ